MSFKAPAPPPIPPLPPVPKPESIDAAARKLRRQQARTEGRAQTILGGSAQGAAQTKTLLGG